MWLITLYSCLMYLSFVYPSSLFAVFVINLSWLFLMCDIRAVL